MDQLAFGKKMESEKNPEDPKKIPNNFQFSRKPKKLNWGVWGNHVFNIGAPRSGSPHMKYIIFPDAPIQFFGFSQKLKIVKGSLISIWEKTGVREKSRRPRKNSLIFENSRKLENFFGGF